MVDDALAVKSSLLMLMLALVMLIIVVTLLMLAAVRFDTIVIHMLLGADRDDDSCNLTFV